MHTNWLSWFEKQSRLTQAKGLQRNIEVNPNEMTSAKNGVNQYIDLTSNDYLGLTFNKDILSAMTSDAITKVGAGAARLAGGTYESHMMLENMLSEFHGRQAALTFTSGYMANVGAISALVGKDDAVVSDKLNHASIIDGVLLSKAKHYRYRHLDMVDLQQKLEIAVTKHQKILIISESIFSMDGDLAPLREIVDLKNRYGALLYLDEAHSIGVRGRKGAGLANELGVENQVEIIMATFGKAYGSFGSYLVADDVIVSHLINHCRTFIFSTAMPYPNTVANIAALKVVQKASEARTQLARTSQYMRDRLRSTEIDILQSSAHIIPIVLGSNESALKIKKILSEQGILVNAIRPPTVPAGTSRLRLSLSAGYDEEDMDIVLSHLLPLLKSHGKVSA